MKGLHHDRVASIIIRYSDRMERKSATCWEWDLAGNCEQPRTVELYGRPSADHRRGRRHIVVKRGTKTSLTIRMATRCRQCSACLRQRSNMWIARALHECRNANRTWFCTLTLRPSEHYRMQIESMRAAAARSIPIQELTALDVEALQFKKTASEVTKWLKRVRKECGNRTLRYLLVQELHKSGLPHYHLLLHETGEAAVRHATLDGQWKLGFTKCKLVEDTDESPRAAFYVAKYLSKGKQARVRASLNYGRFPYDQQSPTTASAIAAV